MRRLIKNELAKLKTPVTLTIALLSVATITLSCTLYINYSLYYDLDAWEVGNEIISFLFPLFVVVPICWNMYFERKNNFLLYTIPRTKKEMYLSAKWIAAAVSAFAVIFIPYFLSAVFALYVKPPVTPWVDTFHHVYYDVYVNTPLLYALSLSFWKGIIGVLVMSFGFVLSLYVKNIFVILTGPFIYSVLDNFIWSILEVAEYRLITSYEPNSIASYVITFVSPLVGPAALIALTVILWVVFAKIMRKTVYEV